MLFCVLIFLISFILEVDRYGFLNSLTDSCTFYVQKYVSVLHTQARTGFFFMNDDDDGRQFGQRSIPVFSKGKYHDVVHITYPYIHHYLHLPLNLVRSE